MTPITEVCRPVPFSFVGVGEEFLWGSYYYEKSNWARKKSSRTASWQTPPKNFEQQEGGFANTWGYWRQNELVYVLTEV